MKTTLEIPDQLYRQSKATAALRGESMKQFVNQALEIHLARIQGTPLDETPGWLQVFGRGKTEAVDDLESILDGEFDQVDPADWS